MDGDGVANSQSTQKGLSDKAKDLRVRISFGNDKPYPFQIYSEFVGS